MNENYRKAALEAQKEKRKYQNEYTTHSDFCVLKITGPREAEVKFDKGKFDLIKEMYWKVEKSGLVITMLFGKKTSFGQFIMPEADGVINHKNRDRYDFREENIVIEDSANYIKSSKYKETEQAPPGVVYYEKRKGPNYWIARYEKGDNNIKKSFNIEKLGFEEAKEKAIKKREEWLECFDD